MSTKFEAKMTTQKRDGEWGRGVQQVLDGVTNILCGCGCGTYFFASSTTHPRLYLNDTHKKRAARQRKKLSAPQRRVTLGSIGWLYLNAQGDRELADLWDDMSRDEKSIIHMLCETGMTPERLKFAVRGLFRNGSVS